jgi:hypothetical protein
MAANMKQVPSGFAALVLECAVDDYDWLIKAVNSKFAQRLLGFAERLRKTVRKKPSKRPPGQC